MQLQLVVVAVVCILPSRCCRSDTGLQHDHMASPYSSERSTSVTIQLVDDGALQALKDCLLFPRCVMQQRAASPQLVRSGGHKHCWQPPQVLGVKLERLAGFRQKLTYLAIEVYLCHWTFVTISGAVTSP